MTVKTLIDKIIILGNKAKKERIGESFNKFRI